MALAKRKDAGIPDRVYSQLTIKAVDDDKRIIKGIASTPSTDRVGDIVDPLGANFKTPLPLLWQHDPYSPIGEVTSAKATKSGISIEARIAKVDSPPGLKNRLEEAWQSIKTGLVRGLSIGFSAKEFSFMDNGGIHFQTWDWFELSAVTIPANADASITAIKSIDQQLIAASGRKSIAVGNSPGVSGKRLTRNTGEIQMDINTQVEDLQQIKIDLSQEMKGFGDVTDLDDEQAKEFDRISAEFEENEIKLKRALRMQKAMSNATPIDTFSPRGLSASRSRVPAEPKKELPKGTAFTRYVMAVAAGRGSLSDSLEYAKRWKDQTPEVLRYIKAVAGTTTNASSGEWGAELVYQDNLASEFVELLRPATVIGRINGWRRVPFNVRMATQVSGSTVNWVGERAPKPVSDLDFSEITLDYHKIAGIVVLTEELVRLSSPAAEETVRRDLIEQIAQFMDEQLLDTTVAAGANNPASLTNGVAAVAATGTDSDSLYADLNSAFASFDTANITTASLVFVMPMAVARGISTLRNALGQFEFTGMNPMGGTLMGYPVIVSNSCPASTIIMINASEIFLAEDPAVRVDASKEATIDMAGGTSPTFSFWQRNCIGLRAEQWITWEKRRAEAVALITGAAYAPVGGS